MKVHLFIQNLKIIQRRCQNFVITADIDKSRYITLNYLCNSLKKQKKHKAEQGEITFF